LSTELQMRVSGEPGRPVLVYLPGLHGNWLLSCDFQQALAGAVRYVEFAYPCHTRWDLPDYAAAIEDALLKAGFREGWLLGESFGSQVMWALFARVQAAQAQGRPSFTVLGLILAGGFVRHPLPWGVRLVRHFHGCLPLSILMRGMRVYLASLKNRHPEKPAVAGQLDEYRQIHGQEDSRQAVVRRYDLILRHDWRPVARQCRLPVFYLTGFWDIIVMWFLVQPWLRRHCPGYRGWRCLFGGEHNILGSQPEAAAHQVRLWLGVGQ